MALNPGVAADVPHPHACRTVADYLRLPEDGRRYQLIDGDLIMSPSPSRPHQALVLGLAPAALFERSDTLLSAELPNVSLALNKLSPPGERVF